MRAPVKPPVSARKMEANRRNYQKSTGPKTPEGKARSRANAVKHGLTGAGIALPTEDAREVEERFAAMQEEMGPETIVGAALAHQIALATVRLQRAARQESAALATKIRHAESDFDESRQAEADHNLTWIDAEPAAYRRKLMATPEGMDRLIERLEHLRSEVRNPYTRWNFVHETALESCFGRRSTEVPHSRGYILSQAMQNRADELTAADRAAIEATAQGQLAVWAMPRLEAYIDAELERVRAHRATLDVAAIALDRAEAGDRAMFDAGRDASLARRYEAAALRSFFRCLKEFRAVENGELDPELVAEPSDATLETLEAGDSVVIPDPEAVDEARRKSREGQPIREPLASFGITADEAARILCQPDCDRPPTPFRAQSTRPSEPNGHGH